MWKAALLTLVLLVALVERVRSNDGHPSFYGVKLCGREFIRAVIFTCGGSRWRRSVGDSGKSVHDAAFFCDVPHFPEPGFTKTDFDYGLDITDSDRCL